MKTTVAYMFALAFTLVSTVDSAVAKCSAPPIKQGQPYVKARQIVLAHGFQAPVIPPYGYQANDQKVISDCFGDVALCNRFPEIESCSGQGQCAMRFLDAYGHTLSIFTYGPLVHSGPTITSFEVNCR